MKTISIRQLLITFVPSVFVLAIMVLVNERYHVKFEAMTRDAAAIANIHPLSGMLSNLGIILWCVAASTCLFAAVFLRNVKSGETFWFLFSSALLSAYLLFDDFFQFHEELASRYFGLDEKVVYGTFAIAASTYLVVFRRVILRTNYSVLLLAIGFLATSVVIDVIVDLISESWSARLGDRLFFFEDGAKWLGIVSWCSYYVRTSHQILGSAFGRENTAV